MGKTYMDLWIVCKDPDKIGDVFKTLRRLGFGAAAIELGEGCVDMFDELRVKAENIGLKLYRKLVLRPSTRRELLRMLRENRGRYEVISVICENLETALVAARDSRVDTIIIPTSPRYRFDKGVRALLRNRVELPFKEFLKDKGRFLRTASEIIQVLGKKTEIIVSSAAENPYELRTPRQLASLLQVLGFDEERALRSISGSAAKLIEENLRKLSKSYVMRGVLKVG